MNNTEYVQELAGYKFDVVQLMMEYEDIVLRYPLNNPNQINLKYSEELGNPDSLDFDRRAAYLNGSLYAKKNGYADGKESDFKNIQPELKGTYLEHVITEVSKLAPIGRVRWAKLGPKVTYSLHYDEDPFRFHVPVQTNIKCLFIVEDTIQRMPNVGSVYKLLTNTFHTAANLSFRQDRHHLIFDTIPTEEDEQAFKENNANVMKHFPA